MNDDYYSPEPQVWQECSQSYAKLSKVLVQEIEEDIEGKDVVSYVCPNCDKLHQSYIVVPR